MKIDTAYIKANVKCENCESSNLKRRHKQSFKSVVNDAGIIVPEFKVNWRAYECMDCEDEMHTTDDGNTLINASPYAMLPFECFDFTVKKYDEMDDGGYHLEMFYTDKINSEFICEDDVRDFHILGFGVFKQLRYNVDNEMENTWSINYDQDMTQAEADEFKALVSKLGATWWDDENES